jgi:hypothetical protein
LREVDLPMLKGIFVAAAHQERELIAISLEEVTEVEPFPLRFVISDEACRGSKVKQTIVAVHGAMELAEFGVRYVIAFGPHLPYSWHPLEEPEGSAHAPASPVRESAQHRRGVPRVGVPVRKESSIEDERAAYMRPGKCFAPLRVLKPTSQYLQNGKRGKVEGDQRRGPDRQMPPDRFDDVGALGCAIWVFLVFIAVAHADVVKEQLRHFSSVR